MAYKKPPEHAKWKPGQSGNYSGRPKRKFSSDDLARAIEDCLDMTVAQLELKLQDKSIKGVMAITIAACLKSREDGNFNAINSMLDRCVGKVKDVVETHNHNHDEAFDNAPRGELIDLLRKRSNDK